MTLSSSGAAVGAAPEDARLAPGIRSRPDVPVPVDGDCPALEAERVVALPGLLRVSAEAAGDAAFGQADDFGPFLRIIDQEHDEALAGRVRHHVADRGAVTAEQGQKLLGLVRPGSRFGRRDCLDSRVFPLLPKAEHGHALRPVRDDGPRRRRSVGPDAPVPKPQGQVRAVFP